MKLSLILLVALSVVILVAVAPSAMAGKILMSTKKLIVDFQRIFFSTVVFPQTTALVASRVFAFQTKIVTVFAKTVTIIQVEDTVAASQVNVGVIHKHLDIPEKHFPTFLVATSVRFTIYIRDYYKFGINKNVSVFYFYA